MSSKYLNIQPNNVPASGLVSFKNGQPILTFTLGRQDGLLDLSSIRVSGNFNAYFDSARNRPTNVNNGQTLTASQKLGVYGIMESLTFRHAETKQVAESIRHYGRFLSSYLPTLASEQDQLGHLSENALIMPSQQAFQNSVIRATADNSFCVPLPCGMTLGASMLALDKFPIEVEIQLCSDSQFFFSTDGQPTNITDSMYELSNVELTCEVHTPEKDSSSNSGMFSFNSITSYFSTLESTNSTINFNLALSKVLSAFVNFVPAASVNNITQDGYLTYMPSLANGALANLDTIQFLKNGERTPYQFETQTNYKNDTQTVAVDPVVIKEFLSAIVPPSDHNRTSISPANSNRNFTVDAAANTGAINIPDGGANWGVGCLYDQLDSEGEDFRNSQFTIQMTNGLTDGNPVSAYLFLKHKTTLAFNESGVQVVN